MPELDSKTTDAIKWIALLSIAAYAAYFSYIKAHIHEPKKELLATEILVLSPIPPIP